MDMEKQTITILFVLSVFLLCGLGNGLVCLGGERAMKPEEIDSDGMRIHREKAMEVIRKDLTEQLGDENTYSIIRGVKGTSQVVAGTLYKLEYMIGESSCRGELTKESLALCLQYVHIYEVSIIEQLWKNIIEVLECKRKLSEGIDRSDNNMRERFNKFKVNFNRTYATEDEEKRYQLFTNNMIEAQVIQLTDVGTAEYGETNFSDMSPKEFAKWMGKQMDINEHVETTGENMTYDKNDVPESFDWRSKGAVTRVKDQGGCGSCWAFSTTGNIEGLWKIKKGTLYSLSEQELIDCDKLDRGCEGGFPLKACREIARLGGIETEKDYPYKASDGKCKFKLSESKVKISGGIELKRDESYMKIWTYKNCPISIGVNAHTMIYYKRGISHPWFLNCRPWIINHGVLITGYGMENDQPFWSVKNSWGPSWGEDGYIRFYRGAGVCGLNLLPTSAVL